MANLQAKAKRQLREIDEAFLDRVRSAVEAQKGLIDAPLTSTATLDDYFLRWPPLAEEWEKYASPVSGGVGLAGLLVGGGAFLPTLAPPVAAPSLWGGFTALFGGGTAAAASTAPWVAFGIPGLIVGALALAGWRYFKVREWQKIREQLAELADKLQTGIQGQKEQLLGGIQEQQARRIELICDSVDHEITRTLGERLAELEAIDAVVDGGEALKALRDEVAALTLRVNP